MVYGLYQPAPNAGAALSPGTPGPPPPSDTEAAIFEAFLELGCDLPAIAAKCGIRSWQVIDWSLSPAIAPRLDRMKEVHQLTAYNRTSRALIDAIDTLQGLLRTTTDDVELRKTCGHITRLFSTQTPSSRKRSSGSSNSANAAPQTNTQPKPPGRILHLPDPAEKYRNAAPNHSPPGVVSEALRVGGGAATANYSRSPLHPAPLPAQQPISGSAASNPPLAPLTAVNSESVSSPNTSPHSAQGDSECSVANAASPVGNLPPGPSFHPHDHFGPYVAYVDDIDRRCSTHPESITKDEWNRFLDYRYGPADNPYHKRKPHPPPSTDSS